jgi:outer membrane protein assembly factor BamB
MSAERTLEREVTTVLFEAAPSREPDRLFDSIITETGRMRQRPRWLAILKEPPMRISTRVAVGSPTLRLVAFLGILLLALATTGAAVVGASLLSGPDLPPLGDVPFYRADQLRSSIEVGPGPASQPELAWEHVLDNGSNTDPILVDGRLIVADRVGYLIALDARTGEEVWRATGDGAFAGAPAASDGIVVAADPASVRAFDAATGAQRWQRDVASDAPRLEIAGGVVYVGTTDGAVRGLDLQTGADRWSWQGDRSLDVRVDLVADGVVYANPNDGRLLAIDTSDGSERWRFLTRGKRVAYGLAGDTVFVTNNTNMEDPGGPTGEIAAIDAATGHVRWRFVAPSGGELAAGAFRDGVLYVDSVQDGIYALRDDGDRSSIVWHADAPTMYRVLTLVGDTLYGATAGGKLFALRADDGTELWTSTTVGDHVMPIISGGMVFSADAGGSPIVRAFADADLVALLPQATGPMVSAPASSPVAEGPPARFVWSTSGGSDGFSFPNDMALDPQGRLWVADTGNDRFVIFEPSGTFVGTWGSSGAGEGQFKLRRPNGDGYGGIAFAPDGSFYVLDVGNRRVQRFSPERQYVGSWGSFGPEPGQYMDPIAIEVADDGTVYVLDDARDVVERYDAEGNVLGSIDAHPDGPGGANTANLMTIDAAGNVYVDSCCSAGNLVEKLAPNGGLVWTVDTVDGHPFADQPSGVAVDAQGRVFVSIASEVMIFDSDGALLGRWGDAGTADGQFVFPYAVLLDGDGAIYVADHGGQRVEKFKLLPPLGPA